jgi:hypothetical protein
VACYKFKSQKSKIKSGYAEAQFLNSNAMKAADTKIGLYARGAKVRKKVELWERNRVLIDF